MTLPGADFIVVEGDKIRSVHGYFDQKTFVEQLGLQAIVVPTAVGPVTFGSSPRVSSDKRIKPGAVSLTWIDARSDEEKREIRERSLQIVAKEMSKMPGFLGWVGSMIGDRMFTATAWDAPASAAQLLLGGLHKEAVDRALEGVSEPPSLRPFGFPITSTICGCVARPAGAEPMWSSVRDSVRAAGRCRNSLPIGSRRQPPSSFGMPSRR